MKGLFFKNSKNIGFEIMSDVLCVRNKEGYDETLIVVKRLQDNFVDLINVTDIDRVATLKEHIDY